MGNRILINILLGVAVVSLAVYLIYTTQDRQDVPAYTAIDPFSVNKITITRHDLAPVVLVKNANGWWMEKPYRIHANRLRINSILQLTRTTSNSPFAAKDSELQQLGLGKTQALKLALNEHEFVFGNTDPINHERYVKYEDTVYLIEDNLYFQLKQDASFFAGTKLVPDNTEIIQLNFPHATLIREGNKWATIPEHIISNKDSALLAERWQNAEATVVNPSSQFDSLGTITVHLKDQAPIIFDVVTLTPSLTLARSDLGIQYFMGNYQPEHLGLDNLAVATEGE